MKGADPMSLVRRLWEAVFGEEMADTAAPRQPRNDAERLALAVLDGDEEAALALADLVQDTYRRCGNLPPGVTFDAVRWPHRAKEAFRRLGVRSFAGLLGTGAEELLRQPGFGSATLARVRLILAGYGLALKGERPAPE